MNKKLITLGLGLTFALSLSAIQPGTDNVVRQASKKALPQLDVNNQAGIVAFGSDNEAIPLGQPIRRVFRNNSRGLVDTLDWGLDGTVNFGFFPGDVMMEVYKAPTDLIMKGVGVDVYGWNIDGTTPSLKVEVWRPGTGGYPFLSDGTTYPSTVVDGGGWVGYAHPTADDTIHYPDISYADGLVWNGFANGGTCDGDLEPTNGQPLMGTKVLPGGFVDYTITNPADGSTGLYWVDFSTEAEVTFATDEYIAVVVTYLEAGAGDPTNGDTRIGLLSGDASAIFPFPASKFYDTDCDGTSGNHGWHIRHYNWRFAYAVELTGDRGPVFESIDVVSTTLSTEDRTFGCTVTDDNPSGGAAGVAAVTLSYQLDSLTAVVNTVSYTDIGDGRWEGTIPGQAVGTFVYWSLTATDVGGLSTPSSTYSYTIFAPTEGYDLVYNNQGALYGTIAYASYLYFYWGGVPFDIWDASYGGIVDELTGHYSTIVELGSDNNNDAEIAAWWGGDKTYIVSGDEWLGARSGWTDGPTTVGSVARDMLGVAYEYNDINYAVSGDQAGVSRLMAEADGAASSLAGFLSGESLLLNYDPDYETGRDNWLDGVDALDGYTVDMTGYSLVLDSASQEGPPADSEVFNVMIHGQQGNGGKSAFLAFDAMALNTVPSYHWVGASWYKVNASSTPDTVMPEDASPLIAAYELLDGILGVEDDVTTPNVFSLKGNYPNPFNPSTNIAFNLDVRSDVTVTVYSILGEEVAKIHNKAMQPGLQSVKWNGADSQGILVASGVYIYRVEAQNHALTGKMMLLK